MGSAAFLMSSFLEVPYVDIMKMAVVPALLFYISAGIAVFFLVRSANLNPPKMEVDPMLVLRTLPVFVLPMTVVIWLLVGYYSPGYAAFYGIIHHGRRGSAAEGHAAELVPMGRGFQGGRPRSAHSSPSSWRWSAFSPRWR